MKQSITFLLLLFISILFLQCNTNNTNSEEHTNADSSTSQVDSIISDSMPSTSAPESTTVDNARTQELKELVQDYYKERNRCIIVSEEPLKVKISESDKEAIDCSGGGDNQLEMNFCSAADACLEIKKTKDLTEQILQQYPDKQQEFLEQLWTTLQAVEAAAIKAGKKYEGGSMQPSVITATQSTELVKARALLQQKWL